MNMSLFRKMLTRTVPSIFCAISRRSYHKIGVIGVPFNKGQPKSGVEKGPAILRESGLLIDLAAIHPKIDIKDYGDVSYKVNNNYEVNNMINWSHVAECNKELSNQVSKIIQDKRICLTLGGDHSIGLGSVNGHARNCENLALIWVDAHADINTNTGSGTGNVHGMPVALLAKELRNEWSELPSLEWQTPLLSLKNIAYIGLRDVDCFEKYIIDKYNITAFDMKDVQNYGIQSVIQMALRKIDPDSNCSLHVSFDIDSLDSLEAPSTGTAVRGGLTLREGIEIMETVCETGRLQAMDLVEVNPSIGDLRDVKNTVEAAKQVICAAFGYKRRGLKR